MVSKVSSTNSVAPQRRDSNIAKPNSKIAELGSVIISEQNNTGSASLKDKEISSIVPSLLEASKSGDLSRVLALIRQGAKDEKDFFGWTALMIAAQRGHKEIVQALIDNRANIDEKSNAGWTALMAAAQEGIKRLH